MTDPRNSRISIPKLISVYLEDRITSVKRLATIWWLLPLLAACGGSPAQLGSYVQPNERTIEAPAQPIAGAGLAILRDASGAPVGIEVTWTRVTTTGVLGYYIYRHTQAFSDGDPAGNESYRVDAGGTDGMYDQPASGDSISFDDDFGPAFTETYYYRITVVNSSSDESDFSNGLSIEITQHTVATVSQTGGSIGDEVAITGTWFGAVRDTDKVFFSAADGDIDVEATSYVSWSATEIVVNVPYGAADGQLGVEIAGTQVDSPANQTFDYNEPVVNDITPVSDWVQNQYITLSGVDFGPAPGSGGDDTTIFFGGTPAQVADINLASWSDTNIEVKVPAAADGGLQNVLVSVAGNDSNTQSFTVLPHIGSLDTTSGNTGDALSITGTTFGAVQGSGMVELNGVAASITSWADTSIEISIPADALDGAVVVTEDSGASSNGLGFDVIPTISGISPTRRYPGEALTISGSGFGANRGSSTVTFDGPGGNPLDAEFYLAWASSEILVVVPGAAQSGTLTISIVDNPVGEDNDGVTSITSLVITLAPPDLNDIGQF